jgi:selenocysteine-specific translation elongation factor
MALHPLVLISLVAAIAASAGCERPAATTRPATAPATAPATTVRFTTDSVSTSKGHGGVILTGTLTDGTVRVRQSVTVHTSTGPVEAKIERIESRDGQYADLPQASKGQKVSLFFPRVTEAQVSQGTRVTGDGP